MKLVHFLLALILFFYSEIQNAADTPLQSSLVWWNAASYRDLVNSEINPDNNTLMLPQWMATSELRPDFKITRDAFIIRARPRAIANGWQTEWGSTEQERDTQARLLWSEAYVSYQFSDNVGLTAGRQNFQWGPAEVASPSNRIVHETVQARDILYDTKGHNMIRANITPAQELSFIFLAELTENGDSEFVYGDKFSPKYALKSEYNWGGGAHYAGLVLGYNSSSQPSDNWIGEYLNLELKEGLTFYVDAQHQQGSRVWYPQRDATNAIVMSQYMQGSRYLYTYAVTGLRYVFESGNDLRLEWVFQEMGYSHDEILGLWTALTPKNIVQLMHFKENAAKIQRNGLDFPGRHYIFSSFRVPDAFNFKDWSVYLRALISITDQSTSSLITSENAVGESGTFFATGAITTGTVESELKGSIAKTLTVGYRHTW